MRTGPHRVPPAAHNPLRGVETLLQVNHCRMPGCNNYGILARIEPGKTGPSEDRDPHYKISSTKKGRTTSIKCKSCGENPSLKSNQGIAEEIVRISASLRGKAAPRQNLA